MHSLRVQHKIGNSGISLRRQDVLPSTQPNSLPPTTSIPPPQHSVVPPSLLMRPMSLVNLIAMFTHSEVFTDPLFASTSITFDFCQYSHTQYRKETRFALISESHLLGRRFRPRPLHPSSLFHNLAACARARFRPFSQSSTCASPAGRCLEHCGLFLRCH